MSHFHLVAYQTTTGSSGIAHVLTDRHRPSWQEVSDQIPDYATGRDLGPAPTYTLRYTLDGQPHRRADLTFPQIEKIGALVMRLADLGRASDIEVLSNGGDITCNFPVFCA